MNPDREDYEESMSILSAYFEDFVKHMAWKFSVREQDIIDAIKERVLPEIGLRNGAISEDHSAIDK